MCQKLHDLFKTFFAIDIKSDLSYICRYLLTNGIILKNENMAKLAY